MFHIIDIESLKPVAYCRVCGIQLDGDNGIKALSCGNICRECHKWKQLEYYQAHKEQCKQYVDPEKQLENLKRWQKAHPERVRYYGKLRESRQRGAGGSYTFQEWEDKLVQFNSRCAYCGKDDIKLTRDHVIPIIHGGSNNIENLVPACRSCNSRKYTKSVEEFTAIL